MADQPRGLREGVATRLRRLWTDDRVLMALMGQVFITMLGIGIVGPVMPLYARSFGVSAVAVGSLVTSFGVARILMNIPAGGLSERFGRRPLLIAGPLIISLAALLTGLAAEFNQLIFFRFIQGLGSSLQTTTAMTVLADICTKETRGRSMSLYQGSLLLGSSFGPTVGGLVGEHLGFRAVFFVYSALALLAAFWALKVVPETRKQMAKAESGASRDRRAEAAGGSVWGLFTNLGFMLVSLVTFTIFFTRTGSRSTVLPLFGASTLGMGAGQMGFTLTLIAIFNLMTLNWSGSLSDKFGRKAVIVPACIVSGLALYSFSLSTSYAWFLFSGALLGIGTGMAGPAPAAYVADVAPPEQRGLTMGVYRTFGDVGVSIGPLLLGWLSDHVSYASALRVNAVLFIVAGLAFGLWARETVRAQRLSWPRFFRRSV